MGRGTSKLGGGGSVIGSHAIPGKPNVWTSGEISFQDMMAISASSLSQGSVSFDKTTTVMPNIGAAVSGKKGDLGQMLANAKMDRFVGNMYRDKSGANDLKRLADLGYKIQAEYHAPNTGSAIPPRDYYFFVKS